MKGILFLGILSVLAFAVVVYGTRMVEGKPDASPGKPGNSQNLAVATFAGGCFWCTEADFEKVPGVEKVISGYTGGAVENPTYEQVSAGKTGHVEAIQVFYDPQSVTYEALLEVFWRHIDPTDPGGQFVDRGSQYRSVIFYHDETQRELAHSSKGRLEKSGVFKKPVVTEILPAGAFYPAEEYHQDYFKKNGLKYRYYRYRSGRDQFIEAAWESRPAPVTVDEEAIPYRRPSDDRIRATLTDLQYEVTQKDATEPPFKNAYWDNKAEGIYVDVVSGEPLFSSRDKFESGTGWPSFTRPLVPENIVEKEDWSLLSIRTEVRSRHGDSHLGHVFEDGPPPTGLRYCVNSAALRFIPREDLEKEGYGAFADQFDEGEAGR